MGGWESVNWWSRIVAQIWLDKSIERSLRSEPSQSNQKNPAQGFPEGQAVNILILVKDNIINIFDMLII